MAKKIKNFMKGAIKRKPIAHKKEKPEDKDEDFIQGAIKRPGALTNRAKKHNRTVLQQAQHDAKSGTTLQKRQANFYLKVLRKVKR